MTAIASVPVPLPPALQPKGLDKWNAFGKPLGTLTYTAKPNMPFEVPRSDPDGSGSTGRTTKVARLPYELFLHHNASFQGPISSFDAALAAAAKQAGFNNVATGVFQAEEGVFYTRQLEAWYPKDHTGSRDYLGHRMTEPKYPSIDRRLSDRVARVEVDVTYPDLKAVVGAETWVDARNGTTPAQPPA